MTKTPFETAQYNALAFGSNLIFNAACSETIKVLDDMRVESFNLLKAMKASETPEKRLANKEAIKLNIQDRKFLLQTLFTNPLEKDV
jgi:hypothetical protein|tara:strand:+ start:718 stop:978 length:261 start_codon:yes stop_codon:yes gene_type:complete